MFFDRLIGSDNDPGCPIGNLRTIACRHLAPWTLEHWFQTCELLDRGVRSDTVVVIVELTIAGECGFDFADKPAFLLRMCEAEMAFHRIRIGIAPRDIEEMRQDLGSLPHVKLDYRVGQPPLQANHR